MKILFIRHGHSTETLAPQWGRCGTGWDQGYGPWTSKTSPCTCLASCTSLYHLNSALRAVYSNPAESRGLNFSGFASPSGFFHIKFFWLASFRNHNSFLLSTQVYVFSPINSPSTFVLKQSRYDLISFRKIVLVHMQEIRFT